MSNQKTFALLGAAGYVAPRHMSAIQAMGGNLVAAMDVSDSVGILDRYASGCSFFTEFERFDRHLDKLKSLGKPVDYLVVCTPNYLHDAHIRYGLRYGAHVICEKPLVVNPWNLDRLITLEQQSSNSIYPILQLRYHPIWQELHKKQKADKSDSVKKIKLSYITPRGMWYYASWKGQEDKSGGIVTNIGIHLFDVLSWTYGEVMDIKVYQRSFDRVCGYTRYEHAAVNWFLSTDPTLADGQNPIRSMSIDNQEYIFSKGMEDLHEFSYKEIMRNKGWALSSVRSGIMQCYAIREENEQLPSGDAHPWINKERRKHPFKNINTKYTS